MTSCERDGDYHSSERVRGHATPMRGIKLRRLSVSSTDGDMGQLEVSDIEEWKIIQSLGETGRFLLTGLKIHFVYDLTFPFLDISPTHMSRKRLVLGSSWQPS